MASGAAPCFEMGVCTRSAVIALGAGKPVKAQGLLGGARPKGGSKFKAKCQAASDARKRKAEEAEAAVAAKTSKKSRQRQEQRERAREDPARQEEMKADNRQHNQDRRDKIRDLADMQADKQELWQKLAERDADAAVAEDRSLDWNEAYRDSLAEWREEPHESHWDKYWRFRETAVWFDQDGKKQHAPKVSEVKWTTRKRSAAQAPLHAVVVKCAWCACDIDLDLCPPGTQPCFSSQQCKDEAASAAERIARRQERQRVIAQVRAEFFCTVSSSVQPRGSQAACCASNTWHLLAAVVASQTPCLADKNAQRV